MTSANLHFSIEADFILRHARDMVLSNDWRGALSLLTEGLEGMSHELACSILKGERTLVDVDGGILDEPQDPDCPDLKRYLRLFAWQQAGVCRLTGGYYQPYAVIPAFGAAARGWAMEQLRARDESVSANRFRALCARWYMESRDSDLVYFELREALTLFKDSLLILGYLLYFELPDALALCVDCSD